MIGERSELLGRLQRYHQLARSMIDPKAREALRAAISGIEIRLAELDRDAAESVSAGCDAPEPELQTRAPR